MAATKIAATTVLGLLLMLFTIANAQIRISCSNKFDTTTNNLVTTCTVDPPSQNISSLEYSLNGANFVSGSHPLIIPLSSLMTGENTLRLRIMLSGGSTAEVQLSATVNQPTQGFSVTCGHQFNAQNDLVITCTTESGSQTLQSLQYSLNGANFVTGSSPLTIPRSSLKVGKNTINLRLTGSGGAMGNVELTVTVAQDFNVSCSGKFNAINDLVITCTTEPGSQTISVLQYSLDGTNFITGSNPLTLSGSSLEVGTNTIYLRLTGNGSTVVNKLITATVSQGFEVKCAYELNTDNLVINCTTTTDSQTIFSLEYSLNGASFQTDNIPLTIPRSSLMVDFNNILLRLTGSGGSVSSVELNVTAAQEFDVNCSVQVNVAKNVVITCTTGSGSQSISSLEYSLKGTSFTLGSNPLTIPSSSLMPGENTISLRLTGSGGTVANLAVSVNLLQGFDVSCIPTFNSTANVLVISCTASSGGQNISSLEYSLDGTNFQSGSNPLTIPGSSLVIGVNTINLKLTGSGGTVANVQVTANISQAFDASCSGKLDAANNLVITCTTEMGSQTISSLEYSVNGAKFISGENPLTINSTSLMFGQNTIDLRLTGSGGGIFTAKQTVTVEQPFDVSCSIKFNEANDLVITCTTGLGSQNISSLEYSVNGANFVSGGHPLTINSTSLMFGQNAIILRLTGSGGAKLTVNQTVTVEQDFDVNCSGSFNERNDLIITCTTGAGSQTIKLIAYSVNGDTFVQGDLPLNISRSSLVVGQNIISLTFTGSGGTIVNRTVTATVQQAFELSCSSNITGDPVTVTCTSAAGSQRIVGIRYSLNGGEYITAAKFPIEIIRSMLKTGQNTIMLQLTGDGGAQTQGSLTIKLSEELTVNCVQGAVGGRTTIQCMTSNNITSTTCSFDGQTAEPCSLPLQLLFSKYGPGNHTVLITFTDEFGQTFSTLQTFSFSPPDINFQCTTSGNLEGQTISCTTSTPINSTTCAYDGGAAESCTLPVTISYSDFSPGNHTLVITVTDAYGQTGITKVDFTISQTIPVTCPNLTDPENGKIVVSGFTPNSTTTYVCNSGYVLVGDSPRTCQNNRQWSGTAPTCEPSFEIYFTNDTPQLVGGTVYAEFAVERTPSAGARPDLEIFCHLTNFDNGTKDNCSNGTYRRTGIPRGDYTLRVVAKNPLTNETKVIRNRLWVHSEDTNDPFCITYLINRGWRVEGKTFTVEFTATGVTKGFKCSLDKKGHHDCSSPFVATNLSPGYHTFRVQPQGCGWNFHVWNKRFTIV